MTHRTTFALDSQTAQRLKRLAKRWQVSQAEVVRRSVEVAEQQPDAPQAVVERRLAALEQLRQCAVRQPVDAAAWMQQVRDARR